MSFKKISCLFVVLLLLAGMTGVAQAADPAGVRLRIDHPADDAWVGIGDSVVVSVDYLPGTAALDSVVIAIVEDTTVTDITTAVGSLTNDSNDDFVAYLGSAHHATSADSDGFRSFEATFQVTAGMVVASSSRNLEMAAVLSTDGFTSVSKVLNNQNTEDVIDGVSSFGKVGDQVSIGIDAQRPTANIDSVRLDTTGISDYPNDAGGPGADGNNASGKPKKAFKVGSQVKVSFFVSGISSGASGIVHITDTANVSNLPDSAMKTVNFAFSSLVSGSATDSTSVTLSAGDIAGDNRRIVAVAFLSDAAGNLSSTTPTDVTPVGVTDVNMHVLDTTSPTITPHAPKSGATDSTYFTGKVDTALSIVTLSTGAAANVTYTATPLKFKTSEGVKSATAKFSDSTLTLSTAPTTLITGNTFTSTFATDFGVTDQAGKSGDLTLTVTDSVGNSASSSQASVTYDQVPPGIKSGTLFPTSSSAPPDVDNSNAPTVNRATMMPILELLEEVDSLAAQYVEVTSGTPKSAKEELAPGDPLLDDVGTEINITFTDTLFSERKYTLQMVFRDLAGNHQATTPDTITFDADFQNPVADSFVVAAASNDSVVTAGAALILNVTAIDTSLTNSSGSQRAAVTHKGDAIVRVDAGDQDISGVTISGTGVTDNKDGTATLTDDDWTLGTRTVTIKSTKTLAPFTAIVENKTADDVNYAGQRANLQVDAGNFATYNVSVVASDDDTAEGVSGPFTVMVQPADRWGNPSSKTFDGTAGVASRSDSLGLIDADVDSSKVLSEVFVNFSSNRATVAVPQGPQAVNSAGSTFMIGGASESGDGLQISVRTVNAGGDTIGTSATSGDDHDVASGATSSLAYAPLGEAPVVVGDLAAPANLVVQDWLGSDGLGDQGGFVSVAFPGVSGASRYRIYREIQSNVGTDDSGNVVILDTASATMVSWTTLDHVGDGVQQAVIPTLDGKSTNWAVAAESGGNSSETTSNKRVFTKQIVQNMVRFLGVDPNRVLSMTELEQVYTPAEDFAASIVGDTDFRFVAVNPDLSALFSGKATPQNIRTQASGVKTSAKTMTEAPVKAVDNIPPAVVEGVEGAISEGNVNLTWTASADDKVVGYSSYRGYAVPIAGVDRYDIYRGASEDALELIGSVPGGTTSFTEAAVEGMSTIIYRVDAADLDNAPLGPIASVVAGGRDIALDAQGNPVYLVNLSDGTPNVADFGDFIAFAGSFNLNEGDAGFLPNADTNDDGAVDFTDFLNFASTFNSVAATVNGAAVSTKPVIRTLQPGVNDNVAFSLNLTSDKVLVGQTVTLNVTVDGANSLQGFGFDMSYDTDKFEFVEATPAEEDLLKTGGAETPVFLSQEQTPGELVIANAVVDGSPVTGAGDVVSLTFRVLTEFEDNARFDLANGIVFDASQLANPVVALGSLSVESTPTEFALLQNFPNPFNPETTIKYNVAEGANVSLRIYNVVGQVVKTLVAEQQNAGRYTVRWNGTDDRGVSVSSGIYFYQIAAGDFSDVKKLMLLK